RRLCVVLSSPTRRASDQGRKNGDRLCGDPKGGEHMTYRLKIRRGRGGGESFWQSFDTPCAGRDTVAAALEELNGRPALMDCTGADRKSTRLSSRHVSDCD